jgi:DNA-binding transcriptional LysR family regulator
MIRKILADVQGEPDFNPSVECAQFDAIRRVVMHSDAVGIATMEALAELAVQGHIHLLDFADIPRDDPGLQLHYGIVSRPGHSLTPAALAMVEAIRAVDQRLLATDKA